MGLTHYPNGISSFGVPVMGSGTIPTTTGVYFYVKSTTGSAGNDGLSPTAPLATVQQAIDKCVAARGDVIILMSGHAETVTSTSITLNKSGVTVIGLGSGLQRPTFTYSTAAATINVTAASCSLVNCHHIGNFLNIVAAVTLTTAKDFVLDSNTFFDASTILNFLIIVKTNATDNAADGLTLKNNKWLGLAASSNAFVSILAAQRALHIENNYVNKLATNDVGHFITLSTKNVTGTYIGSNKLVITGAAGALVGVFLTGSGTGCSGLVTDNYVASLDTTTALIATAGTGLYYIQNFYTGAVDASGAVWPVADNPA